jgi:MFS family permease
MAVIAMMAILSPLASAMFNPAIPAIAKDLNAPISAVVGSTTGFLVLLGIGPLVLAPLSETFGRRKLYLVCFTIFALIQIPTALSPNIEALVIFRALSGFFGSLSSLHFYRYILICL